MKKLFIAALLLLSFKGVGQIDMHGTLGVAIICKDAIVLAIDSRVYYGDNVQRRDLFTHDLIDKVVTINNHHILTIGRYYWECQMLPVLASEYSLKANKKESIDNLVETFSDNLAKTWPPTAARNTEFIGAEYKNNVPCVFHINYKRTRRDLNVNAYSDLNFKDFLTTEESKKMNSDSLIKILPDLFKRYIRAYNKANTVHGPLQIIKVTPKSKTVVSKENFIEIRSNEDIILLIKNKSKYYKALWPNEKDILLPFESIIRNCAN